VAAAVGGQAVTVDLSDLDAIDALDLDVDVLVNNAGLQHVAPLHEFPVDRFSFILRLMLEAPFRLVRGALPHMYGRGWGRVVNISSVHGLRASAYKSAYVTAKHGMEGLSKVIALEGAEHGVTSNCVNPAYVRTPLVEGQIADQARAHGLREDEVVGKVMLARAAVKRLIEPEEVADAVTFLCSPAGASMSGSSLVMDGGWSAS
jgi:3-hydroxybutyrate dehydrogenase